MPDRKYTSSFDCRDAGDHDKRPGARCPNCLMINASRKPRKASPRPTQKRDGLDDLRNMLRF